MPAINSLVQVRCCGSGVAELSVVGPLFMLLEMGEDQSLRNGDYLLFFFQFIYFFSRLHYQLLSSLTREVLRRLQEREHASI